VYGVRKIKLTFAFRQINCDISFKKNTRQAGNIECWIHTGYSRDARIFQKLRFHIKILGDERETGSKYHTKCPQIIDTNGTKFSDTGDLRLGICAPLG
jgi:hypothetical protein